MKPGVKYRVIFKHRNKYSIAGICRFFKVSRSGYYDFVKGMGKIDRDEAIAKEIARCQELSKKTYGYRRIQTWLMRETGLVINHKAVLRINNKYSLLSEIRKPRPLYMRQQALFKYENRLSRDFSADTLNYKWVTDISYIHTKQGVLYVKSYVFKSINGDFTHFIILA